MAGTLMGSTGKVARLEEMLVGVFGAFIGGEFLATMVVTSGTPAGKFSTAALGIAIGSAVTVLVLLRVMRKAVGPLRSGKSPAGRRR